MNMYVQHECVDPGREAEIHYAAHYDKWSIELIARLPLSRVFAFYRLLARPWWRRAWIRQEISVSEAIIFQWGYHEVPWMQMHVALHMARTNHYPWSGLSSFVEGEWFQLVRIQYKYMAEQSHQQRSRHALRKGSTPREGEGAAEQRR